MPPVPSVRGISAEPTAASILPSDAETLAASAGSAFSMASASAAAFAVLAAVSLTLASRLSATLKSASDFRAISVAERAAASSSAVGTLPSLKSPLSRPSALVASIRRPSKLAALERARQSLARWAGQPLRPDRRPGDRRERRRAFRPCCRRRPHVGADRVVADCQVDRALDDKRPCVVGLHFADQLVVGIDANQGARLGIAGDENLLAFDLDGRDTRQPGVSGAAVAETAVSVAVADAPGTGSAFATSPGAVVAAGGSAGVASTAGLVMMRLASPGFDTMASSSPALSFGIETVATSSEDLVTPFCRRCAGSTDNRRPRSGLSKIAAKSPVAPTSAVPITVSPLTISSLVFG